MYHAQTNECISSVRFFMIIMIMIAGQVNKRGRSKRSGAAMQREPKYLHTNRTDERSKVSAVRFVYVDIHNGIRTTRVSRTVTHTDMS